MFVQNIFNFSLVELEAINLEFNVEKIKNCSPGPSRAAWSLRSATGAARISALYKHFSIYVTLNSTIDEILVNTDFIRCAIFQENF